MNNTNAATPYARFQACRYFGSLDGLRAVSILAVIWHHAAGAGHTALQPLGRGALGVHLFFAISGFLITTLLLRERAARGEISLRQFYIRRTLRIFPLYYAVLALYVALVWLTERESAAGRDFFRNLPFFATYTSNWFVPLEGRVIFYFAWSLAAEEQFYLIWPWVERTVKRWMPVALMGGVLGLALAVQYGALQGLFPPGTFRHTLVASIAPPICMGVLLAHLLHAPRGFEAVWALLGGRGASLALAALLTGLLLIPGRLDTGLLTAIHVAMTLLVAACVIRPDHWLARLLEWPPAVRIGMVSYGMYLLHMLALNFTRKVLGKVGLEGPLLEFLLGTLVTYAAAWISFRYFESFFLKLKNRHRAAPVSGHV